MKAWFLNLTRREQRVLMGGAVVLLILLVMRYAWWPLFSGLEHLHEDIDTESELLAWMTPRVNLLSQNITTEHDLDKSVASLERAVKTMNLQAYMMHMEVFEHERVSVQFQEVPMPALLSWLSAELAAGWQIEQATFTPAARSGTADVLVLLK